ncbi:hypothetical protein NC99_39420 [Sunxiuqinia dokdonensis]|uniref:Uncharacterized protein n=1 Tax=Sunxiuqinia dokdonensis TaxID=1409788 RepID=A0A0L8V466_9BACT|nr:hypothetical protein NC99_39420 [Sunxiuqinia dokdonensis]
MYRHTIQFVLLKSKRFKANLKTAQNKTEPTAIMFISIGTERVVLLSISN